MALALIFRKESLVASVLVVLSLPGCACVRKMGSTINDNFYILRNPSNKSGKKGAHEVLSDAQMRGLSQSIKQTMKTQKENIPHDKTTLSNADVLENEVPALSALIKEAKNDPRNTQVHFKLAQTYHQYRAYEEARIEYQKAIDLDPHNPIFFESMGRLWRDWGAPQLGMNALQRALQLDPSCIEAWNSLGTIYVQMGDGSKAQEAYLKALAINPGLDFVQNNLSYSYLKAGDLEDSIRHGEEAVRINPLFAVAHNNLGIAYGLRGDFERAYQEFKHTGDEAGAHNNLGVLLLEQERVQEAMDHFRIAGKSRPSYKLAADNYNLALKTKFEKAKKGLEKKVTHLTQAPTELEDIQSASTLRWEPPSEPDLSMGCIFFQSQWKLLTELGLTLPPRIPSPIGFQEKPVVRFEIVTPKRLSRLGQTLVDYLADEHRVLTRFYGTVRSYPRTVIYYKPDFSGIALSLAHHIPGNQEVVRLKELDGKWDVKVVLGSDLLPRTNKLTLSARKKSIRNRGVMRLSRAWIENKIQSQNVRNG